MTEPTNRPRWLAVIPARGGSKRIPRKNIKDFLGKPIISYPIEATKSAGFFDEIMVSTDDVEIAETAHNLGVNVPFLRSAESSNDHATTNDVLKEVLDQYSNSGRIFDFVTCIYPTSVFIDATKICEARRLMEAGLGTSLMTVTKYGHPIQRALSINGRYLEYCRPDYRDVRTQDLPPAFYDVGQMYMSRIVEFGRHQALVTPQCLPLVVDESTVQDIDNESDWLLAEMKYQFSTGH